MSPPADVTHSMHICKHKTTPCTPPSLHPTVSSMLRCRHTCTRPQRADLVAVVGETWGESAFSAMRDRMRADPVGRRILEDRPLVTVRGWGGWGGGGGGGGGGDKGVAGGNGGCGWVGGLVSGRFLEEG
jgi:hypothetical protein